MKYNNLFFALMLLVSTRIWADGQNAQSTDAFVDSLLARMTLDEKIGQLNQLNCDEVTPELLNMIRNGEVGSLLNVQSIEDVIAVQNAAMNSKHKIPLLIARDVIHGYKTIFPIPIGQASTFNPDIVEAGARVAAEEASQHGIKWTFAPMLDIARDPRWGRIAESLGEDAYLASELGRAMVTGFQGNDLKAPSAVAACAKHFAGYGAAEGGRDYNSTYITPRQLHNVYLPPFISAINADVLSVMASFNANDGIPSTGNKELLRAILRDELGFSGVVVSDWNAVNELIVHGITADGEEAACLAIEAGVDIDMNSQLYHNYLKKLVKENKVSVSTIDAKVSNVLRMKYRLGLFDSPCSSISKTPTWYSPKNLQSAKEAATQSVILLKNASGTLPLDEKQKIAVIGPMADAPHDQLGTWIFDGEKEKTITPIEALRSIPGVTFNYDPILNSPLDLDTTMFNRLPKLIDDTDVVVVFVGEPSRLSGEASSLSNIDLIGKQSDLIKAAKRLGKPVVTIVMAGRPLTIGRDMDNSDAMLYSFHSGTMGGPALVDLLFGYQNPSGHLPVTFVKEAGQIPMYYNHDNTGRPAPANMATLFENSNAATQTSAGDVSCYLDSGNEPLFPFGYGLSYTDFTYSETIVTPTEVLPGDSITITATITNTGKYAGTDVAQLYIQDCNGSVVRPVKELKGFKRIELRPRESKTVMFRLSTDDLKFYGLSYQWLCESGTFKAGIGADSSIALSATFLCKSNNR